MGAREDVLAAARALTQRGLAPFSPIDLIAEARRLGSDYEESTLRTFIVGPMCTNSPDNHAVAYHDLVRVRRGQYELTDQAGAPPTARPQPSATTGKTEGSSPEEANTEPTEEWYWEGNVQSAIVGYLVHEGWEIRRVARTASREHGIDIDARRNGQRLLVEVKGYPSKTYVRGPKRGQRKATQPALQARAYFSHALLTGMLMRSDEPDARVVLAFPDFETYRNLTERTAAPLLDAGIELWLVSEDGVVAPSEP